jgi:hypothetical protein
MSNSQHTYYTEGYKYRTSETITHQLPITLSAEIRSKCGLIIVTREGLLIILAGYSSDGPSGLTFDTKDFMLAAFIHDALYELLRQDCFNRVNAYDVDGQRIGEAGLRYISDVILRDVALSKGMWKFRARYVFDGVRAGGLSSATVRREIHKA